MKLSLFCLLILSAVSETKSYRDDQVLDERSPFRNGIHLQMKHAKARTCLDYLQRGKFENGFYWLSDDSDQRYVAYCDLASEPGAAWTLVMSWDIESKDMLQFKSKAFMQDAPINHKTPNWYSYRQTLARMRSVRNRSTYWRATCSFNEMQWSMSKMGTVSYRDYLRGKFSEFDIMKYVGRGQCLSVDYVNIRGHAASATTAQFWQVRDLYALHIDSSYTGCVFRPNAGAAPSEDNFGFNQAVNGMFRCTHQKGSTTQWWFGAYMAD